MVSCVAVFVCFCMFYYVFVFMASALVPAKLYRENIPCAPRNSRRP